MKTATCFAGLICAVFFLGLTGALANDYTVSEGKLSDRDFYRAIACGASVDGWCKTAIVKWPQEQRRNLKIFVEKPQDGFPPEKIKMVIASVRLAITEINISGADIQLEFTEKRSAQIHVHMVNARVGETITGTGNRILDGRKIQGGLGVVRWKRNGSTGAIVEAYVGISSNIPKTIIRSVVLEEVVQVLGLWLDIRNPYYTGRSIFAEDANNVYKIRQQDMLALRLHYPTGCEKASECLDR